MPAWIPSHGQHHADRSLHTVQALAVHPRPGPARHAALDLDRIARATWLDTHTPVLARAALGLVGVNLAICTLQLL